MTFLLITRSIRSRISMVTLVLIFLGTPSAAFAGNSHACRRWLKRVARGPTPVSEKGATREGGADAAVELSHDPWQVASLSEAEKVEAIQCLLGTEDDLRPAAFSGAMRLDTSQTFAPAPVNLAALYAISYIYSGRFDHAAAVALRGENASYTDSSGNYVTKVSATRKAYQAYRTWFAKASKIGFTDAHRAGLQPLDDTGLRWY